MSPKGFLPIYCHGAILSFSGLAGTYSRLTSPLGNFPAETSANAEYKKFLAAHPE
jgi:hypothetical protein